MSYIVVSGESPRHCTVEVVPETNEALMDAVARAAYGDPKDEPAGAAVLTAELLANEEIRFEDGFIRLYMGEAVPSQVPSEAK